MQYLLHCPILFSFFLYFPTVMDSFLTPFFTKMVCREKLKTVRRKLKSTLLIVKTTLLIL